MAVPATRRRPCVVLAGCYLAGRSLIESPVLACLLLAMTVLMHFKGPATFTRGAAAILFLILGGVHAQADRVLDRSGVPFSEQIIHGVVLESPERSAAGDTILRLESGGLVFRLKVRPSPEGPEAALLALRTGDRVQVWARCGVPAPLSNPGSSVPARTLRATGIHRVGTVKSARLVELDRSGQPGPRRAADHLRARLRSGLDRIAGGDRAVRGLLGAMLLGDRAGLPPALVDRLRSAGLVHLIAISGLHIGLILLMVLGVLQRSPVPRGLLLPAAAVFLSGLVLVVGAQASILRAAAMAIMTGWGRRFGRNGDSINTLAATAMILLVLEPAFYHHAGFRLSFSATAGILLGYRRLRRLLPLPLFPGAPLALSSSAYLSTAPWTASLFGTVAPVAVLSNLVSAPLCGLIVLSGYLALVLTALGVPTLGMATLARAGCRGLITLAEQMPDTVYQVPAPSMPVVLGLVAVVPVLTARRRIRGTPVLLLAVALGVTLLHLGKIPPPPTPGLLEVTVPDVGQGQAVLILGGTGVVLADAGGSRSATFDPGARVVAPLLAARGIHRLDVLAISHQHLDHAGGAKAILHRFEVGGLWIVPGTVNQPLIRDLAETAWSRRIPVVLAGRGMVHAREGWRLTVLHPGAEQDRLAVNDRSMVLRFQAGQGSILLPGDLEQAGEQVLLEAEAVAPLLDADLLVAGHHGAAGSCSAPFLQAVSPQVVFISAGRGNRYGHPDVGTVQRLEKTGAKVWSSDLDGQLTAWLNGSVWSATGYSPTAPERTPAGK